MGFEIWLTDAWSFCSFIRPSFRMLGLIEVEICLVVWIWVLMVWLALYIPLVNSIQSSSDLCGS